jgi:hypothetical protein
MKNFEIQHFINKIKSKFFTNIDLIFNNNGEVLYGLKITLMKEQITLFVRCDGVNNWNIEYYK